MDPFQPLEPALSGELKATLAGDLHAEFFTNTTMACGEEGADNCGGSPY